MLYDLPPEIVSEIASYLSYRDIALFCKALPNEEYRNATNAHVVWLNLAAKYLADNPHSQFASMPSLSSLTTDQLRYRFEKRLMINETWRLEREIYPSMKRLRRPLSIIAAIGIAPGGRWLFCGTDNCTVSYLDLDSNDPEPLVLARPDGESMTSGTRGRVEKIDFLVECGDPLTRFVIAFVECDWHGRYYQKSREWLYIWDVIPQEDSTLVARRIKSLPLPYNGWGSKLSFNQYLAARSMKNRVDAYWWRECTETHLVRCTLLFTTDPTIRDIYVLGHDKLLVYTHFGEKHKVRLYTLEPELTEVGEYQKVVSYVTKIWSFRFYCEYYGREISRLYFDGTSYRQIIATLYGIYTLVIPASQVDEATWARVSDFKVYRSLSNYTRLYGLGPNKGYCCTDEQLYRFGYREGNTGAAYENGAALDQRIRRILYFFDNRHAFDEELGRLVSITRKYLILHDFSLPLSNIADVCPDSDQITAKDNMW